MKIEEINEINIKFILQDYTLLNTFYNGGAKEKINSNTGFNSLFSNIDYYIKNYENRYKRKVVNVILNSQVYNKNLIKEGTFNFTVSKDKLYNMYFKNFIECNVFIKNDNREYLFLVETKDGFELNRLYVITDKFLKDNNINLNNLFDVPNSLIVNNLPTIKKSK